MSFTARYRGWCADCDSDIEPGQEVTYRPTGRAGEADDLIHVKCPEQLDDDDKAKLNPLCPRCFTYHAGEC